MNAPGQLRLGTRASPLARWQAEWVAGRLAQCGVAVELVPLSTRGDQEWAAPIGELGGQGVFTKELERALLAGRIDLVVHSLKDLPTDPVEGLALAALPERGPSADVLVSREGRPLEELPPGAVVGTGSLRRRAQLWHVRPDLRMEDVRGNVDTRLRKLAEGRYDALVLAEAGLVRLGLAAKATQVLPPSVMLPAVGQGALGVQARSDDARTIQLLAPLDHFATRRAVLAERAMLAALGGGCLAPVGACGRVDQDGRLQLCGVVLSADGSKRLLAAASGDPHDPAELGRAVADDLMSRGAGELIQASRGHR